MLNLLFIRCELLGRYAILKPTDLVLNLQLLAFIAPRVLVLMIAFTAVLQEVRVEFILDQLAQPVDRIPELAMIVPALDRIVASNQKHSVEPALQLVQLIQLRAHHQRI